MRLKRVCGFTTVRLSDGMKSLFIKAEAMFILGAMSLGFLDRPLPPGAYAIPVADPEEFPRRIYAAAANEGGILSDNGNFVSSSGKP